MAKTSTPQRFAEPKCRQLLAVAGVLWIALAIIISVPAAAGRSSSLFTDPLITPIFYIALFGVCSLWVLWRYRRRGIELQNIFGPWPSPVNWRYLLGLLVILFMFSLGAFQVSYVLLSFVSPEIVTGTLQDSLFLGPGDTLIPWLYNALMLFVLVIAAPVLEEFLFRGFLLHRWGTRWNLAIAVMLSSVLFGVLHGNAVGLTVFGLVMALLYLRTNSLGVVIVLHSLNNAIAASLELIAYARGSDPTPSLEEFRAGIWLGALLLVISIPLLIRFMRRHWPQASTRLPYFVNCDRFRNS